MKKTINNLNEIFTPEKVVELLKNDFKTLHKIVSDSPVESLVGIKKKFEESVEKLLKKEDLALFVKYKVLKRLVYDRRNNLNAFDQQNQNHGTKSRKKSQQTLETTEETKIQAMREYWMSNPDKFLQNLSDKPERLIQIIENDLPFLKQFVEANPRPFLEYANNKFKEFIKANQENFTELDKAFIKGYIDLCGMASKACENMRDVKLNLEENPLYQKRLDQKAQENRQNLQTSENKNTIGIKRNYLEYIKDNSTTKTPEHQKYIRKRDQKAKEKQKSRGF